jgi:uncharacterized protein
MNQDRKQETVSNYFAKNFPLIKLFEYGKDTLLYDSKSHFAFILSDIELKLLINILEGKKIYKIFGHSNNDTKFQLQLKKLQDSGVFLKGPLTSIASMDENIIEKTIQYYDANIVTRKFCLEVTEDCNFRCKYCPYTIETKHRNHSKKYMTDDIAYKAIDYYFNRYITLYNKLPLEKKKKLMEFSPPGLSWYGGETFLNFELIKKTKNYFERLPWDKHGIKKNQLNYGINSNLSIFNNDIMHFLASNNVKLYASLDGPKEENDKNRIFKNGRGTFDRVFMNLMTLKKNHPDYFKNSVLILSLDSKNLDMDRCLNFFENLKKEDKNNFGIGDYAPFPMSKRGEIVLDAEEEYEASVNNFNEDVDRFKSKISVIDIESFDRLGKTDSDLMDEIKKLKRYFSIKMDNPSGRDSLNQMITCPMGFDNLMVSTNGDFHMCHLTDGSVPIGNCSEGLNFDKIKSMYLKYNKIFDNKECKSCWAFNFCDLCAAVLCMDNNFFHPTKTECDYMRLLAENYFLKYIALSMKKELFNHIFNYFDEQKGTGIIDIQDI